MSVGFVGFVGLLSKKMQLEQLWDDLQVVETRHPQLDQSSPYEMWKEPGSEIHAFRVSQH